MNEQELCARVMQFYIIAAANRLTLERPVYSVLTDNKVNLGRDLTTSKMLPTSCMKIITLVFNAMMRIDYFLKVCSVNFTEFNDPQDR